VREYVLEILSRMDLPRRDRRDIWFESNSGASPLRWLQETFLQINNGRHADFSIPKRIEVTVPHNLLQAADLRVRFIDTKGIDQIAARPDIESYFNLPHTVIMLCSRFNEAPSDAAKLLLQRAVASGNRSVTTFANLLVLPHPGEALEVKEDGGSKVESQDEGYELKREQIESFLHDQGLLGLGVGFFNARGDDQVEAKDFLREALLRVRSVYRSRLASRVGDSEFLLGNLAQAEVQQAIELATSELLRKLLAISQVDELQGNLQDSLWAQFTRAYAATVRATVRREGEWYNFNFGHHFGYGLRTMAVKALQSKIAAFSQKAEFMLDDPNYREARGLIAQAKQILEDSYDQLLKKAALFGQDLFKEDLAKDSDFWSRADDEWGRGPGYKDRVRSIGDEWFALKERRDYSERIKSLLDSEWSVAISSVKAILEPELA
jgi:hypothetical protein